MIGSATRNFAQDLSSAILNSDDINTVERGLPAYLLLLDGLLEDNPDNPDILMAAADLNSAYASVFTNDPEHAKRLTDKAFNYASRAVCVNTRQNCNLPTLPFAEFERRIETFRLQDIDTLYTLGASWAGHIEAHSDDWNAIANIGKVQAIMERVIALDENHDAGAAHIYLGVMATLLPPALGGKPEIGRTHFERAIKLSKGTNLMAQVNYARRYARLMFDRKLHDRLLKQVTAADAKVTGFTLSNTIAKKQAEELLNSADEYF